MTGSGTPDTYTRAVLRLISVLYSDVPVWGFFDYKVHGFQILQNFRRRSCTGADWTFDNEGHQVPKMEWQSLRPEHLNMGHLQQHQLNASNDNNRLIRCKIAQLDNEPAAEPGAAAAVAGPVSTPGSPAVVPGSWWTNLPMVTAVVVVAG
ncbi:hypothetical protein B484DRAFT_433680 [Ochromonadaceae sp. CCMP2298]|nr:hypothetical protein B484DRAFT_433680 [Ochromonadaceae sp. CCMP2298]